MSDMEKSEHKSWYNIWVNYVNYNLHLLEKKNQDEKKRFLDLNSDEYRHKILNSEKIGMKIPAEVKIIIDSNCPGWPALFAQNNSDKSNSYLVLEPSHSAMLINFPMPRHCADWCEKADEMDFISGREQEYLAEVQMGLAKEGEDGKTSEPAHIDVTIPGRLNEYTVAIRLPFFNPKHDQFRSVYFKEDNQEIVLSSCC